MDGLKERVVYAIAEKHDFIACKDGKFVSGEWKDVEYAKSCGWTVIGTVAEIVRKELR